MSWTIRMIDVDGRASAPGADGHRTMSGRIVHAQEPALPKLHLRERAEATGTDGTVKHWDGSAWRYGPCRDTPWSA
jgi:hypothetical protein